MSQACLESSPLAVLFQTLREFGFHSTRFNDDQCGLARDRQHVVPAPALCSNVKRGDRVLVLSDTAHDARVWQVVQSILCELGADVTVALFERRPADYYDPPAAVCESMMRSDINVLVASTGMLHCPANFRAMEAGIPAICMDGGMTLEMFQSGAVTEDMKQIAVRKHYVAHDVFGPKAKECRVTSRYGTDLTLSRRRSDLRAAAAVRDVRPVQDHQLRQGREPQGRAISTTTCSRPASSTSRRSKAAPTASSSST